MARPRKEIDLKAMAKKRHEELTARREMIDAELKSIAKYLKSVGAVKGKRGRSEKTDGARAGSATAVVLSAIEKSKKGISIDQIMEQTGSGRQTVNGILARMKKEEKIKTASRGIYIKA